MFAYCNNNPVAYADPSGYLFEWIDDACDWIDNNIVEPVDAFFNDANDFYQKFKDDDGTLSLYDSHRFDEDASFHEQLFSITPKSVLLDTENDSATLFGAEVDLIMWGWEFEHVDLSLFDIGHAEVSVDTDISDLSFDVGALASVWSPSISFDTPFGEFSIGAEVISVGGGYKNSADSITIQGALGAGVSVVLPKFWE